MFRLERIKIIRNLGFADWMKEKLSSGAIVIILTALTDVAGKVIHG